VREEYQLKRFEKFQNQLKKSFEKKKTLKLKARKLFSLETT